MKRILCLLTTLSLLLSGCNGNKEEIPKEEVFLRFNTRSFGEQYVLESFVDNNYLEYIDLSSGDLTMRPLCSSPNCTHNDKGCTAYMLGNVYCPFIYNNKLHYFAQGGATVKTEGFWSLYEAETDGTNQKVILELETGWFVDQAQVYDGKFIFTVYKNIIESGVPASGRNYQLYCYNFRDISLLFETGVKYDVSVNICGIINDCLYYNYQSRDYPIDFSSEDFHEIFNDKNSIYYQDLVNEMRKMPLKQKDPYNPKFEVLGDMKFIWIDKDCYYYSNFLDGERNKLQKVNASTRKAETLILPDNFISIYVLDDNLYFETYELNEITGRYENFKWYQYIDSEFVELIGLADIGFDFICDSKDYLFCVWDDKDNERKHGHITKTDFYNGDYDKLVDGGGIL